MNCMKLYVNFYKKCALSWRERKSITFTSLCRETMPFTQAIRNIYLKWNPVMRSKTRESKEKWLLSTIIKYQFCHDPCKNPIFNDKAIKLRAIRSLQIQGHSHQKVQLTVQLWCSTDSKAYASHPHYAAPLSPGSWSEALKHIFSKCS